MPPTSREMPAMTEMAMDRVSMMADMDSTMIGQECIDELADYAGMKEEIAAVTDAASATV